MESLIIYFASFCLTIAIYDVLLNTLISPLLFTESFSFFL